VVDRSRPAPGPEHLPANAGVTVNATSFSPPSVTITAGESVTWTYGNGPVHIIHDVGHACQNVVTDGRAGTCRFSEVGTYEIYCLTVTSMRGSVRVVAAVTSSPAVDTPPSTPTANPSAAPSIDDLPTSGDASIPMIVIVATIGAAVGAGMWMLRARGRPEA